MELFYTVSKSRGTVGRELSLLLLVPNQHQGDCLLGVHPVSRFPNLSMGLSAGKRREGVIECL